MKRHWKRRVGGVRRAEALLWHWSSNSGCFPGLGFASACTFRDQAEWYRREIKRMRQARLRTQMQSSAVHGATREIPKISEDPKPGAGVPGPAQLLGCRGCRISAQRLRERTTRGQMSNPWDARDKDPMESAPQIRIDFWGMLYYKYNRGPLYQGFGTPDS